MSARERAQPHRRLPPDGFTLLEVLIAFAIAALALAALFGGAVGGLRATGTASAYEEAVSLARSHLAALGHGDALGPQVRSGADGGAFTWRLRVVPAGKRLLTRTDTDRANDVPQTEAVLYDVTVTEAWKDGAATREVSLATRRFATHPAEGAP